LDILAGRKAAQGVSGSVGFNNRPRDQHVNNASAYVMQASLLYSELTVRETLTFAAQLRLSGSDPVHRNKRIESVMQMLKLSERAGVKVGGESQRGLSGGEVRRLAIGSEIVHFPSIIYLDEPTTGLDSSSSLGIMSILKDLANRGRTVICTVHQPSQEIFALLDKVLLLATGRAVYFGPSSQVCSFFSPYSGSVFTTAHNSAELMLCVSGE
jgi:ABC-type multidrug transport system ATPase subunit